MAAVGAEELAGCAGAVEFALACGAALSLVEKEKGVNFRNDHMPYLGLKARKERALKFLSIAVTILLLAVGVYFQAQWMQAKKARADIRAKFEPDYVAVMIGKKFPTTIRQAVNDVKKQLTNLMAEKGIKGASQESISGKLALVLQALNSCAAQTGLAIDTISITPNAIRINGSTNSRRSTVNGVFEALRKFGLKVEDNRVTTETKNERDSFDVTVKVEAQTASEKS
jgi:hypothetical protein